jgi:nucleotide-binding universal stress UspA family protein
MLPLKKILCPTDFSQPSYEALKVADEMALHFSAELLLMHVVAPIPMIPIHDDPVSFNLPMYEKEMEASAGRSIRQVAEEKVSKQVQTRILVVQGDPAGQIVKVSEAEQTDIIVIATHGLTGWRKFMFGSVTEKVIRMATCPVFSIRVPAKR